MSASSTVDIDGAGNRMANIILGNRGDNGLNGGLGADTVIGGSGADSLTGGSGRDTLAGEESPDTLLGGIGADSLAGGLGSDRLMGGTNADTLDGGPGRDTLTGDGGADRFDFDTALAHTNVDRIVDFSATNDLIHLDIDIFNGIALGALHAGAFRSGAGASTAQDANDRIVYDTSTGCLYYDGDGAGGAGATLFAIAEGAPAMAATNFFIAI